VALVKKDLSLIESPTISVVMPIYNAQQDLREAIESILNQSFSDFELLIIDDGSTDQSAQIARSFIDTRIRFIRQPRNFGLVAALNKGLAEARGQFIARMDGDDICLPDRFALQLEIMQDQKLDICGSHWAQIDAGGHQFATLYAPKLVDEVIATLATTVPYAHGSVMLRKSFLDQYKLQYKLGYSEDYDLWIRFFELGAHFGFVDTVLYLHRTHPQSITSTKSAEQASSARQLRRKFVQNNIGPCQDALATLQERFQVLPKAIQVHTLYLAYRVFSCSGNAKPFLNLFFKTSLINQVRTIGRIVRA
jgi:glycosyltransferase involved in cell wall biosynthesis